MTLELLYAISEVLSDFPSVATTLTTFCGSSIADVNVRKRSGQRERGSPMVTRVGSGEGE